MLTHNFEAMCDDLHLAKLNRKRVAEDYCSNFYRSQEHVVNVCPVDHPLPSSIVVGELHEIRNRRRRLPFMGLRYVTED